jgi:AhpD family alkylhydroperoxidase
VNSMPARLDYYLVAPEGVKAVQALEQYQRRSELEPALIELVKLRASLINGCAYCVDVHTKDARAKGETEQRLFAVPVWRETPFFSPRERAALAWTEAVTEIARSRVSDAIYDDACAQFTERELVDLTLVASRLTPGTVSQ